MKLRALLSAGVIACSGIASAQDAAVITPAPTRIELKLSPGQVRAFKISIDQTGTMTLPGSGQNMPLNNSITAYAKLIVDKQNSNGTWAARYKVGGLRMVVNGTSMPMPGNTGDMMIKGTLSKTGNFTPADDSKGSAMGMGMSPAQSMNNVLGNLMNLPDKPVSVGDTWTNSVPLPFDTTGQSIVTVVSKVLAIDNINGDQIVQIMHDTSGPLNMTMSQPIQMTISGTMKGSGISKVSVKSGTPLDDNSTQHLALTINGTNPSGNGEQMNMSMNMDVTSHIESMILPKTTVVKPAAKTPVKKAPAKKATKK